MSRLIRDDKKSHPTEPEHPEVSLPLSREAIVAHLKRCQALVNEYSKQSFNRYAERLDEAFNLAIDSARSNQEVAEMAGVQRIFRKNRSELERYYTGYIAEGFVKFKNKELRTELSASNRGSELSLVDNEDLDEMIILSSVTHKMDSYFAEPLWALNQRFAVLNGGEQVTEACNPAAPIQLCESLRRALRLIPLTPKAKTIAYRTYEEHLTGLVGSNLDELNAYLKRAGILPNLKYMPPKTSRESVDIGGTEFTPQDLAFIQSLGSQEHQGELLGAIRSLQHSLASAGQQVLSVNSLGDGAVAVLTTEQVVGALQNLQLLQQFPALQEGQVLVPADIAKVTQAISEQVKSQGGNGDVSADDMRTIDLVGMVFEYMLGDENLPDSVKALLSYMHTPFLKLAFSDPDFFEKSEHPARVLLNSLAEAGSRFIGNDGSVQFDMYQKIKDIVERVIKDFRNDPRIITELFIEFNSYTKNIIRRQELMEKRATEKVQGEEKLREVKIRVNEEVLARTTQRELPSAILLFLLQPWSDYLSFVLLRHGEDSDMWDKALSLVDELLWIIEPKNQPDDVEQQGSMLQPMLAQIREGFDTIGYDPDKGDKLADAIASLVDLALQNKRAEPAPAPMRDQLEKIAAEKAGQKSEEVLDLSEEEAKVVDNLKLIEFGTWFEFEGGKRLKVAWYNARTSHYMLVDQMGKKVAMKSGLELARDMIGKRAKIISGSSKPFFERALENIFQKLAEQKPTAEAATED
jgi:hypothetical protein